MKTSPHFKNSFYINSYVVHVVTKPSSRCFEWFAFGLDPSLLKAANSTKNNKLAILILQTKPKGVTIQMKALDEVVPIVRFTLLLKRVLVHFYNSQNGVRQRNMHELLVIIPQSQGTQPPVQVHNKTVFPFK